MRRGAWRNATALAREIAAAIVCGMGHPTYSVIRYGYEDRSRADARRTRALVQDELFLVEVTEAPGEKLRGTLETASLGTVTLARHTTRTAAIRRRHGNGYHPNPIGSDTFQLTFQTRGGAMRLSQRARAAEMGLGDAALIYGGDAFEGDFEIGDGDNTINAIILPSEAALDHTPHAHDAAIKPIDASRAALRLLRSYAGAVLDAPPSEAVAAIAERHILDLWRAVLDDPDLAAPEPAPGIEAARAALVLGLIARRYRDPALSLEVIAAGAGLSPRAVQRALAAQSTSFRDALSARRLARAAELLRAPSWSAVKIVDIAYASGFGDLSHFNRAFRARYGMPPGAWRAG